MFKKISMFAFSVTILLATYSPGHLLADEKFPTKPITILVPYSAGGSTDLTTRALGEAASKTLGQPIVVEDKPGGSGAVAIASLLQTPADGYSLLIMGSAQIANQYMNDVPYNVLRDLTPIIHHMSYNAGLVVRSDSPWKTFKEFFDYVKANPGKLTYGSSAAGTPQHLVMERLCQEQGLKMKFIPFGSGIKAVTALLGGHIEVVSQVTEWKPYVESGELRLLVTYGTKRMPQFPDVPTLIDLGYNITQVGFNAVVGPRGVPPDRVKILAQSFKAVLDDPNSEFNKLMVKYDVVAEYMGPEEFAKYLKRFDEETRTLIESSGIGKK
jgi:tripartite-type tricarboxylate transporter receptor subunit TctC